MREPLTCVVDERAGVRESVAITEHGIFAALVEPMTEPRGAVLLCPPILRDSIISERKIVMLARRLGRAGFAAMRFHYRGYGNSLQTDEVLTFSMLQRDGERVAALVAERVPGVPLGFVGTRFGCLVAAVLASKRPDAPLVLWDPPIDAARYFREAARAARVVDVAAGEAIGEPSDSRDGGQPASSSPADLEVLGFVVPAAFREEAASLRLLDFLAPSARRVFVAKLAASRASSPASEIAAALRSTPASVEFAEFPEDGTWWFTEELATTDVAEGAPWPLLDRTVEFLADALSPGSPT